MSARYMQPLRIFIQFMFAGLMVWLGYRFLRFLQAAGSDAVPGVVVRPDGVDGFLPISGLLGAAAWMKGEGINTVHPAAVVIFMTVVAVSFLLRRSFCSWICPIALISECFWKLGFRLLRGNIRAPRWLDICLRVVKYLLLAFFIYSVAFAMSLEAMREFINSDYHKIADIRLLDFFLYISPLASAVIMVLAGLSVVMRNPFCRYLCPYGALLGLVAALSPVRVTRDAGRCVSCGACSQVCPSGIDVMHKPSVASVECIGCWRCVSHCRFNEALSMRAAKKLVVPGVIFALLVVLLFWSGTMIGKMTGHWRSSITLNEYVRLLGK